MESGAADLEDKYLRLRDENSSLKSRALVQDDDLKRLRTKLMILEESIKRGASASAGSTGRAYLEYQEENSSLKTELARAKKRLRKAEDKVRELQERLRRKPSTVFRQERKSKKGHEMRHASRTSGSGIPPSAHAAVGRPAGGSPLDSYRRSRESVGNADAARMLQKRLKERLAALEGALRDAKRENATLRDQIGDQDFSRVRGSSPPPSRAALSGRESKLEDHAKDAELASLRARLARAEEGADARRAVYERATGAFEEQAQELRDARQALQRCQADCDMLRKRADDADRLEDEVSERRAEVHQLEARLQDVLSSPFFAQGEDAAKSARRLKELEASDKKYQEALVHLRSTVQEQYQELRLLRARLRDREEALREATDDARRLRERADDAARGTASLRKHLSIFAGADGTGGDPVLGAVGGGPAVPLPELEEALAIVRRKADWAGSSDEAADVLAASTIAKRLKETRVLLLDSQQQSERQERLLAAQREQIYDLEEEAKRLRGQHDTGLAEQRQEMEYLRRLVQRKYRLVSDLQDQRAALLRERGLLQQQVRKLAGALQSGSTGTLHQDESGEAARGRSSQDVDGRPGNHDMSSDDVLEASASTLDSFSGGGLAGYAEKAGQATSSRGETDDASIGLPLEVWIESGEVSPALLGPTDSSFVAVDAWDFETQCSPIAAGPAAAWNFAPVFPLPTAAEQPQDSMRAFRWLRRDSLCLSLTRVRGGEAETVGTATVPLVALLSNAAAAWCRAYNQRKGTDGDAAELSVDDLPVGLRRPRIRFPSVPVRAAGGAVVGSLCVEMRLGRSPWPEVCMWLQSQLVPRSTSEPGSSPEDGKIAEAKAILSDADDAAADVALGATRDMGTGSQHTRRSFGQLVVTVHRCTDLAPSAGGRTPVAYCQVVAPALGGGAWESGEHVFFSQVAEPGISPMFDEQYRCKAARSGLGSKLVDTALRVRVFDDTARAAGDLASTAVSSGHPLEAHTAGLLGECAISLSGVLAGYSIRYKSFPLSGPDGSKSGNMVVSIAWDGPCETRERESGTSPDDVDAHSVSEWLSLHSRPDGSVFWRYALALASMPDSVWIVLQRIREAVCAADEAKGPESEAHWAALLSSRRTVSADELIEAIGRSGEEEHPVSVRDAQALLAHLCSLEDGPASASGASSAREAHAPTVVGVLKPTSRDARFAENKAREAVQAGCGDSMDGVEAVWSRWESQLEGDTKAGASDDGKDGQWWTAVATEAAVSVALQREGMRVVPQL